MDKPKYRKLRVIADPENFFFSQVVDAETGESFEGLRGLSFVGNNTEEKGEFPYITLTFHALDVEFVVAQAIDPKAADQAWRDGKLHVVIGERVYMLPITADAQESQT